MSASNHMVDANDFGALARYYDLFERKNAALYDSLNGFTTELFHRHEVRNVVNVSCGTGAQAIPLARGGFNVVACDLDPSLLAIARENLLA